MITVHVGAALSDSVNYANSIVTFDATESNSRAERSRDCGASLSLLLAVFEKQQYGSFCGPASVTMLLRACGREPAVSQADVFETLFHRVLPITRAQQHPSLTRDDVHRSGFALDEIAHLLQHEYGFRVAANRSTWADHRVLAQQLRTVLTEMFAAPPGMTFVIVNLWRVWLGHRGGHFSPLAAYDKTSYSVLLLDTSKNKPWHWIPVEVLARLMMRFDHSVQLPRGFLVVQEAVQ